MKKLQQCLIFTFIPALVIGAHIFCSLDNMALFVKNVCMQMACDKFYQQPPLFDKFYARKFNKNQHTWSHMAKHPNCIQKMTCIQNVSKACLSAIVHIKPHLPCTAKNINPVYSGLHQKCHL
jgi:hypothetical protein